MPGCAICGGRFAEHNCPYCGRAACSSCMNVEVRKCIKCENRNSVPWQRFIRQNYILIAFVSTIWLFTVFPWPFLYALGLKFDLNMGVIQPILIASILIAMPFIFMLRVWKKRPPK